MNSNFLLSTALALFVSTSAVSQYSVSVSYESYADLSGATVLDYIASSDGYYYATNFLFTTFGSRVANFNTNVSPPSAGGFVSGQGYLAVYETPGYDNTVAFQGFYNPDLKPVNGISRVSAKVEGAGLNRTLKVEFRDLVYNNDTNQRVSFQMRLKEADSTLSYHFGPNSLIARNINGFCGIVVFNPSFTALVDECNVEGSPAMPNVYDSISNFGALPTLDSFPLAGTVISFSMRQEVISPPVGHEEAGVAALTIGPNPTAGYIHIHGLSEAAGVSVTNLLGETVLDTRISTKSPVVDVRSLKPGQYLLFIQGSASKHYRIVVED